MGGVELYRFAWVIAVQRFAVLLKGITMKIYRVDVLWGTKKIKHYAADKYEAQAWIRQYQKIGNDIIVVARNRITGKRVQESHIYR